jgi:dihydroxyacetone kinase
MLDALLPAADALEASAGGYAQGVAAMVAAAQAGADATRDMQPRRGRSTYLGDRTAGHADPGAVAVSVWLGAIQG